MNASSTALVFVGLLLTLIGLFVAGNIVLIALGVVSLFGTAFFQAIAARAR
jgi:hypothetical protein